jgi:heme-binding NEAT domain protein
MKKSLSNSFASIAQSFVAQAGNLFAAGQTTLYSKGSLSELGSQVWSHYGDAARDNGKLSATKVFELMQAEQFIDKFAVSQSQNCKFVIKHISTYKGAEEAYYPDMLVPLSWADGDANGKYRMSAAVKAGAIETRIDKDGKVQPKRFNSQHPVYAALVRTNPERPVKAKPAPRQTVAKTETETETETAPVSSDVKSSSASLVVATLTDWSNIGASYMAQKPSASQRAAVLAKLTALFGMETEDGSDE